MATSREFRTGHTYNGAYVSDQARAHFGDNHNHYHAVSKDEGIKRAILEALKFEEFGKRSQDLSSESRQAFDWILGGRDPDTSHFENTSAASNLQDWLRAQRAKRETSRRALRNWLTADEHDSLFWITGKPGSGKSTLMKSVQEHSSFRNLSHPALNNEPYIVAEHYFWIAGPPDQRSLASMFKAFLHGLMSALPVDEDLDILKLICGYRWSSKDASRPWSYMELQKALHRACHYGLKIIFLIDGLDECNVEDHTALIRNIIQLSAYRNVKLLVSSRPWKAFAKELDHLPHLRLEELTFFEMCRYVEGRLVEAESLQQDDHHFRSGDRQASSLISTVAFRAEGVFLWAVLVTRALASEVRKGRSVESLYDLLEDFPDGLKQYLRERIFERVLRTERNKIDTANSLQLLILIANNPLDCLEGNLVAFALLHQNLLSDASDPAKPDWYDRADGHSLSLSTISFLAEACGDLVHIVPNRDVPLAGEVQFIHRSAFDFLHEEQSRSFIGSHCAPYMNEASFVERLEDICFKHIARQRSLDADTIHSTMSRLESSFDPLRHEDLAYLQTRRDHQLLLVEQLRHHCPKHLPESRWFQRYSSASVVNRKNSFIKTHFLQCPLIVMRRYPPQTYRDDWRCAWNELLETEISDAFNPALLEELSRLGCDFNEDITTRGCMWWDCFKPTPRTVWAVFVCRWVVRLDVVPYASQRCKSVQELEDVVARTVVFMLKSGADPDLTLCLHNSLSGKEEPQEEPHNMDAEYGTDHTCSHHSLDQIIRLYLPERWHSELLAECVQARSPFDRIYRYKRQKLRALRELGDAYPECTWGGDWPGYSFASFLKSWHPPLRVDLTYTWNRKCDHCGGALIDVASFCLDCIDFPLICRSCVKSLHIGPQVHLLTPKSARARPVLWPARETHLGHFTIDMLWLPGFPVAPLDPTATVMSKFAAWYDLNAEAYGVPKSCDSTCWHWKDPDYDSA